MPAYILWAGKDGAPVYQYKRLKPGCLEPHLLMDALAKHEGAKAADAVGAWLKDFFRHEFAKRAMQAMGPGAERRPRRDGAGERGPAARASAKCARTSLFLLP